MSNKDPFFIVEEDEGVQAEKSAKKQIPDIQSHTPRDIDVNYYGNNILTGVDPALLTNQDDLERGKEQNRNLEEGDSNKADCRNSTGFVIFYLVHSQTWII